MLWVFGDSFSIPTDTIEKINSERASCNQPPIFPIKENWIDIVSKKLTDTNVHQNFSLRGCSNEFIYQQLRIQMPNIAPGDYVIVVLTAKSRRWLLKDWPQLANWAKFDFKGVESDNLVDKKALGAVENYARYLYHDEPSFATYDAFVHALCYWASELYSNNIKLLPLPGFDEFPGYNSTLNHICEKEFADVESIKLFYQETSDRRFNQLSGNNHHRLADKIVQFHDNNVIVDLASGFETDIYTVNNIKNYLTS